MSVIKPIPISKLLLDVENPRHGPITEQSAIVEYLVKNAKVKQLASDIVEKGVSPIDLLAVVDHDSTHYIAVEGNRRLCALVLLNNTELCPQSESKFFKNLSKGGTVPDSINAVVFDSREEANIWIERRHSGEQNGMGTLQWDAVQKTRWNKYRERKDPNALALEVLEYAKRRKFISEDDVKKTLTTATRYLSNPLFRKTVGIITSSNDPDPVLNVEVSEFNKILKWFCEDLVDNDSDVNSRSKKEDRESYAQNLTREKIAPETKCAQWKLEDGLKISDDGTDTDNDKKPKRPPTQDPDKRKHLVPRNSISVVSDDKFLIRALKELNSIEVDKYPLAAAMVCRAFLERVYRSYHQKFLSAPGSIKAHVIMSAVAKHIQNNEVLVANEKSALAALKRVSSDETNVLSPKSLGANAHLARIPAAVDLKREWDNIESIVQIMLNKI